MPESGRYCQKASVLQILYSNFCPVWHHHSFANSKKLANVTFKGTKAVKVGSKAFKGTSSKMKVVIPKKMSKKTLNTLKRNLKKAGISKKTVYKKK